MIINKWNLLKYNRIILKTTHKILNILIYKVKVWIKLIKKIKKNYPNIINRKDKIYKI